MSEKRGDFPEGVAAPAIRSLNAAGYSNYMQMAGAKESELSKLHGVGPNALKAIRAALQKSGKDLA